MAEITPPIMWFVTSLSILAVSMLIKLILGGSSRRNAAGLNLPPGPRPLPVIGNMHSLLFALPHRAMQRLAERHGPVLRLRLGHIPAVVVSSPEAAREVMKAHDAAFASRPMYVTADVLTYGGQNISFAPYGSAHWKAARKLCATELLSARRVLSFRPVRDEEAARLVRSVAAAAAAVNVSERIKVMMNDVVMRAAVGDRCPQREEYLEELDKVMSLGSGFNLIDLFPTSRLARRLGGRSLRATRAVHERVQSIMDAMIRDHTAEMESGAGHEREDILDVLLRYQRDGGLGIDLTTEKVSAVLWDVFSAGSETAATTTIWAMSELVRNPPVMERAQCEVREVLRGKTRVAEVDFQDRLPYLRMVIKETFRLHPPLPLLLPRLCGEPSIKIMGYDVPQGTNVFVNVWAIGRDEENWTGANKFSPERFEHETVDYSGTDFRFLPGGAGRRMCPGMMFGLSNIEIALASLLYHFDWKLPGGGDPRELDMTEGFGATTRRKNEPLLEATPFEP